MTWPLVPLGTVLRRHIDAVPVDASQMYPISGVYSFGRGLLSRTPIRGTETTYKTLHRLHCDDLVVSQLKAWEGAIARVPMAFDGWFLSPQFATFRPSDAHLDIGYLGWYCKQTTVWNTLKDSARGMGARRDSVPPGRFLELQIPLPPLDEQRRIVARLDAVAQRVAEARRLRAEVTADLGLMLHALVHSEGSSAGAYVPMGELVRQRPPDVDVDRQRSYAFAGVYSFGRGAFSSGLRAGSDISYRKLTRLRAGDLVYPKLMAWEGAIAIVPPNLDGLVVSTEFPVFEVDRERVHPKILDILFRQPEVWAELSGGSTGTNVRRRRLQPADFLRYRVAIPTLDQQTRIVSIAEKAEAVRRLQDDADQCLDTVMPALLDRGFRGEL